MNWFQQNRSLRIFLGALGVATLFSLWFLIQEKAAAKAADERLSATTNELDRLRRSRPFPNRKNLRKTREQTEAYRSSLLAFEKELKTRMFPRLPLQPNEFQAQLRLAVNAVQEHAATAKVQLPAGFHLGFDEYAASLPNLEAAPGLGRQLRAIEWIANTMIDAHIDSLGSLIRTPLPEEEIAATVPSAPSPSPARAAAPAENGPANIVDFTAIDLSFSGSPAAVRRLVNEIAAVKEQFYVIRTLTVKNQVGKGPKREEPVTTVSAPVRPGAPSPAPDAGRKEPGITFIVGTEHLYVAARVEILKFNLPEAEAR